MAVPGVEGEWNPGERVSTDFYELYWAHLMSGTSWHHVTGWLSTLMLRSPGEVPQRLVWPWRLSWLALAVAVFLFLGPARPTSVADWSLYGALTALVVLILKSTGTYFGLDYVGDCARYLSPTPPNVAVRQAIRSAAVELLEGLHDDPSWRRYHRIVLVGHSLGSVIGYDALTHLWQRRHHPHAEEITPAAQPRQEQYERVVRHEEAMTGDPRELQSAVWREQRAIGVRWKITDFVTLGSPLAHAPFLLATSRAAFHDGRTQREFPTCPPQPIGDRDREYGRSLLTPGVGPTVLHHAAPFACTRWTNLYFEKDLIGGRIDALGAWITNRELTPDGAFPHTRYWRDGSDLKPLLDALDLDEWWRSPDNIRVAIETQERDTTRLRAAKS